MKYQNHILKRPDTARVMSSQGVREIKNRNFEPAQKIQNFRKCHFKNFTVPCKNLIAAFLSAIENSGATRLYGQKNSRGHPNCEPSISAFDRVMNSNDGFELNFSVILYRLSYLQRQIYILSVVSLNQLKLVQQLKLMDTV